MQRTAWFWLRPQLTGARRTRSFLKNLSGHRLCYGDTKSRRPRQPEKSPGFPEKYAVLGQEAEALRDLRHCKVVVADSPALHND